MDKFIKNQTNKMNKIIFIYLFFTWIIFISLVTTQGLSMLISRFGVIYSIVTFIVFLLVGIFIYYGLKNKMNEFRKQYNKFSSRLKDNVEKELNEKRRGTGDTRLTSVGMIRIGIRFHEILQYHRITRIEVHYNKSNKTYKLKLKANGEFSTIKVKEIEDAKWILDYVRSKTKLICIYKGVKMRDLGQTEGLEI